MKKLIPFAAAAIMLVSCGQKNTETASNPKADSLLILSNEREESVNQFIASFNEIERNLDSVAVKQQIINLSANKTGKDLKPSQKTRILSEINAINRLMQENTEKIAELNGKLKKSGHKNHRLSETINTLNNQLAQKNNELTELNERLSALDAQVAQLKITVDSLTNQNLANAVTIQEKSETISQNLTALHTAYYVIGKKKELQEAKLIDRQGGLLGMGKTSKLNPNFDQNKFTRIDYTQTATIPVNSDGAKIITTHPSDSYTLDTDEKDKDLVKNIIITNPEKFWSASKYLVVVK